MQVGDSVIFYTKKQRDSFENTEELFLSMSTMGEIVKLGEGMHVIKFGESSLLGAELEETVPIGFIRKARFVEWYNFWRSPAFYANLWGYFFFILFFLIFIK